MAYDQNSSYEAPRRAYYDRQQPPPAPAHQNGYGNEYAEYANTPYDQYDQGGYSQGYQQQQGGYNDGYDPRMHHAYNGGYQGGPQRPPPQDRHYQQDQGRSYDPRYQPRAPRAPPPLERGPPPSQRGYPPERAQYQGDPRAAPKQNGYPPQGRPQRDPYDQQAQYEAPPQQSQSAPRANGKSSMEEWKAREKAKMKTAALSPETLAFDNAFPVFPNGKSRPDSKDSSASGPRGSVEPRPSTSQSSRPHVSREDGHQAGGGRPKMDRNQSYPEGPNGGVVHGLSAQNGCEGGAYAQRPPTSRQAVVTPVEEYPEQWPMVAGQTPPKTRHAPPQTNGYDQGYARGPQYEQSYGSTPPVPQVMAKQRAPPVVQPIDTHQAQEYQRPAYRENQPLSPANVPPRPSTSHAARQPQIQHAPLTQQPYSATAVNGYANAPGKPWMQQQDHGRSASLGDIYDDYGAEAPAPGPGRLKRTPTTREEEIEADMPDFDSAAPAQTSNLYKRAQTVDKHPTDAPTTSLPPSLPTQGLPQSSSAPDVRYEQQQYQQAQYPPQGRPHPGPPRGPPRRAITGDPHNGGQRPYDAQYGTPPAPDPRYQQHDPRNPQGPPMRPPQAPFATEPPVRRSLDDGRQMPYRNGPPPGHGPPGQQRFYQNGPRGGPPPMRPGFDRNPTAQTVWSDPGQERAGSAPPGRQGPRPPGAMAAGAIAIGAMAAGAPMSQQRSAPEQQLLSNPDALPHHPVPVRPGLMDKPPPVRSYPSEAPPQSHGAPHQRQSSINQFTEPVTLAELDKLRAACDAAPNNHKQTLLYVKKLVEASAVLATGDPRTVAKNREKWIMEAYKRLKRAVSAGYPDAQFYLADCYGQGMLGLEVDTKEAFKLYQAAAKAGHPQAAYRTAVCCEMGPEDGGGTSKDFPKAVQWYRRAAALGDGPAMYKLGAVLLKGLLGQQRNITEAVIWLKRGVEKADADHPHALHELAGLYESSNTSQEVRNKVVADDNYARDLYTQSAQLGYKFSQFRLGQAYEYGTLGLPIDNRSSIAWYTKAAAQGEHQAELALSGWYLTGAGGILEQSDTEAYLWARKAASSEPPLAKAMFAMGYFTENGIGCPKSFDEAKKWYSRSASYRFPKAVERLEELKKNGGKAPKSAPQSGKLSRKDQKKDEENCVVM